MSICYAIKDWEKHFENSESRKIKSLTWVPMKNKHDGKGYRRVVSHPKSIQVFCAWNLLVQVASKMPVRGLLRDDDGPLTTSDLSFKTGFPEAIFEEAFKVLTDPKIAWLVSQKPDGVPASPETSRRAGVEGNGMEQTGNGTEVFIPPRSSTEKGSGEKPSERAPEIPSLEEAIAQTMVAGIAPDFVEYVYGKWSQRAGKDASNVIVSWLPYVTGRWKNECVEWRAGTHQGKNDEKHKKNGRVNTRNLGMSETAADKARDIREVLARRSKANASTPA